MRLVQGDCITNIVPVFEVGQDGDTAFYAMQFIQGQSLDQVLGELRWLAVVVVVQRVYEVAVVEDRVRDGDLVRTVSSVKRWYGPKSGKSLVFVPAPS